MSGAIDDAARHERGESGSLVRVLRGRCAEPIAAAVQGDRRSLDAWALRETPLDLEKPGLSRRISDAVTIGMNHHVNEVGVVEDAAVRS